MTTIGRGWRAGLVVAALVANLAVPATAGDAVRETRTLAAGTRFETPAHVHDSGEPGPTVLIVAGVHGDEPASPIAAEQVRHWPLANGRLVVVPRANVPALRARKRRTPDEEKPLSDLNRCFPQATDEPGSAARGVLASALWELVLSEEPDWVLDLHEGFDVHRRNPESVGQSVIGVREETTNDAAAAVLAALDATVGDPEARFSRLGPPIDGSLARAAVVHAGSRAMIVETSTRGTARSTRAWRHRVAVHALLGHLGMLAEDIVPADVGYLDGVRAGTVVAVYDGGGTSGRGVPNVLAQAARYPDTVVARIGGTEIRAGSLAAFDVVVFPGGSGSKQARFLRDSGRAAVREFVDDGGGYVGICAGAYLACRGYSWGIGVLDARTASPRWRRGVGRVRVEAVGAGADVLGGPEGPTDVLYANGPILVPADDPELPDYETLVVFRTELAKNGTPKGVMVGAPAAVRGAFGDGRVVCFSPHPEQTDGLETYVRRAIEWAARVSRE